jgi:hypothetical protein
LGSARIARRELDSLGREKPIVLALAMMGLGDAGGLVGAAVGNDQPFQPLFAQMPGRELDHLAGAHQQCRALWDIAEDLFRQAGRGIGDRYRVFANGGFGADLLGHGERVLEKPLQRLAQRTGGRRVLIRDLGLAEYLRLAEHQRIQATRHGQQLCDRLAPSVAVQVGTQPLVVQVVLFRQPAAHEVGGVIRAGQRVDLGAIAGGDHGRFVDAVQPRQMLQRALAGFGIEYHPLADFQRRGLVAESQGNDRHSELDGEGMRDCRQHTIEYKHVSAFNRYCHPVSLNRGSQPILSAAAANRLRTSVKGH